jgi:hypothetical protein
MSGALSIHVPIEPDLLHSAGVLLRGLIRDLFVAVTEHRRVWHTDTASELKMHGVNGCIRGSCPRAAWLVNICTLEWSNRGIKGDQILAGAEGHRYELLSLLT